MYVYNFSSSSRDVDLYEILVLLELKAVFPSSSVFGNLFTHFERLKNFPHSFNFYEIALLKLKFSSLFAFDVFHNIF